MSAISTKPQTYIDVKFEKNNDGIFHPGDIIEGIVELYVEKRIKQTKGLKLEVTGIANCGWTKRKIYKNVKYEGFQKFMEHVSHFFGRVDAAPIEVSVGVHLYTFSCKIPMNAATSYEGKYGTIKYNIKVTLDIPFMHDVIYEKSFTVLRIENLNDFPWLSCKSNSESDIADGVDCCETLPLVITLIVDNSGVAVGEELKVKIEACNQGPAKYTDSILALDRVETCASQFPILAYKKSYKILSYVQVKSLKPFEKAFFEEALSIPKETHGTSEVSSETVRISYQIRFSSISNRRTKVQAVLPIFIGHIPFVKKSVDNDANYDLQSEPVIDVPASTTQKLEKTKLV